MNRFQPGNRIALLRNGSEYFPALVAAIDAAEREVWLETYIFADDASGQVVTAALVRAARRGVLVRVLVDGWGARLYLKPAVETSLAEAGVTLLKYRPEVAPWQFRSHRLRRLHRKLVHVDAHVAFVGGINIIDDMNTPGHRAPRVDFAVRVEGPLLVADRAHDAAGVVAGRAGAVQAQRRAAVSVPRGGRSAPAGRRRSS